VQSMRGWRSLKVAKTANVQFGVVMTTTDEHSVSTLASHVGQRHGLIVKHQVRDRPGHPPSTAEPDA
jgi:hypothetical protein